MDASTHFRSVVEVTTNSEKRCARPTQWHGKPVVVIMPCYAGSLCDGEAAVRPLQTLADPLVHLFAPRPYVAFQSMIDATQPHGRCYYRKSEYLAQLSGAAIEIAIAHTSKMTSPFSLMLHELLVYIVNVLLQVLLDRLTLNPAL